MVLTAVAQDGWAVRHASDALRLDKDVIVAAVRQQHFATERHDKEALQVAGTGTGDAAGGSRSKVAVSPAHTRVLPEAPTRLPSACREAPTSPPESPPAAGRCRRESRADPEVGSPVAASAGSGYARSGYGSSTISPVAERRKARPLEETMVKQPHELGGYKKPEVAPLRLPVANSRRSSFEDECQGRAWSLDTWRGGEVKL